MSLSTKILLIVAGLLLFSGMGFIIFKQIENSNRQIAIETQLVAQKQLVDNIARSQSQWATKDDVNKFITDNGVNLKAIQDDLNKLNASVNSVNTIVASSNGWKGNNIPSSGTGNTNPNPPPPGSDPDPYGYMKKEQLLSVNEDFGTVKVPFGQVGFSAWQSKPWSADIYPRDYHVTSVVGTDENQRSYFYNKFTVQTGGKSYDIPIKVAETKQEYPEAKWSWFNPRLFVGADGGVGVNPLTGEFIPNVEVGIMSYGRYKNQPDFSILQAGVGYGTINKNFQVVITPVAWNFGKYIPLMNNTYLAPSVSIGADGNVIVGGGIRVGL